MNDEIVTLCGEVECTGCGRVTGKARVIDGDFYCFSCTTTERTAQ